MSDIKHKIALMCLIHDLHQSDPDKMYCKILRDRVRYLKTTKEGQQELLAHLNKIKGWGRDEARDEIAENMIIKNFSYSDIAEITGFDIAEIEKLAINVKESGMCLKRSKRGIREEDNNTNEELMEEGREEVRYEAAEEMIMKKFPYSDIAEIIGFDITEIEELAIEMEAEDSASAKDD